MEGSDALEREVAAHYARGVDIAEAVLDAFAAAGGDRERPTAEGLAAADQFHLGGERATAALAEDMGLREGMRVLDLGCGIGGPARLFASRFGCRVVGVDLSAEYVAAAQALTDRCGLGRLATFRQGTAAAIPAEDGALDAAVLIHVGMNVPDKAALFAEVRRVLAPGGRFGVLDVVRTRVGEFAFPMPWAAGPATSFLEPPQAYRDALARAGFVLEAEHDRAPLAREAFAEMRARLKRSGPPAMGLHVLIGPGAKERMANVAAALEGGLVAPVQFVARRA
jgi:SAM-dependent methyltransferase